MGTGANGGDVEYILRADDGNIEADLNKANAKVEKAAKKSADDSVKIEEQKTKDLKSESDKVVKNAEKAADDVAEAWEEAGQDAKKAMEDISDGDVEVGVEANTANAEKAIDSLEADDIEIEVNANTSDAESKIKSVSKDKNVKVKGDADMSDAEDEVDDFCDRTKEKISDSLGGGEDGASALGNIRSVLSSSFSDAAGGAIPLVDKIGELTSGLSGAQVAAIGAGAAVVGISAIGVSAANDMQSAMNGFLAVTGKGREETERYQNVLESIYANNYGESFEDIAGAMGQVTQTLGDMDDVSLQNITESAFALRDTFGYEIPESTRAAKAMIDNFGISGEEAMELIAAGAQNGLDYSGELLDSISEYSVQFDKMGLDANDMFNIFQKGAESGAFNLDKVGDAVKEMSIRVVDGSDTTREGFELLGLNADEMVQKFAAGGDTAKEAFNQTLDALAALEDPIAQNTAGVDLMGTMWEDLGPEAVSALADIQDEAYATGEELNGIKDIKYDDLGAQFEELKRNVELAIVPLGESLMPVLMELGEAVLPLVTDCLAPLLGLFAQLISPILSLVGSAITPLITAFAQLVSIAITPLVSIIQSTLLPIFTGTLNSLFSSASSVIGNITNIFRNLLEFVQNVFAGNWRGAWNNVREIFSNAISGLASIFKAPMNAIVDGWNSLVSSIGSISVPEWVPIAGGKSFSLPRMSRLKVGLDYVPSDMFPAFLDEGEWVLTKEEANVLRSLGGIEGVLGAIGQSEAGKNPSIVVQSPETEINYEELGNAVATALIRAGVGFKCDDVVFARLIKDLIDYA